mmetsp:Transcript_10592/g.9338  ORF Transcript_10592/g.9338 Transcript_10592/m.9338 type:complete len:182 (+) Transcript_10592:1297-1842(+)
MSNKRKPKKHQLSIGHTFETNTIDNTNQNSFATQLISLIKQLHSPSEKSHNHSQSEAYSQNFKKIVHSKKGQHYKIKPKSSKHSRSNTSDNQHKVKRLNQFTNYNNLFKNCNDKSIKNKILATNMMKVCKKEIKKSPNIRVNEYQSHLITENTFQSNPQHNKSMLGEAGGTFNNFNSEIIN